MHQLLLMRHGKSSWDEPKLPDRDRPLNKRGRRATATMRETMRELGLAPDLVLVSPSRRTQETLAALEPWDETPLIETMENLYLASAPQIVAVLHGVSETVRSVLLIGHNPGMHELAMWLAKAPSQNATKEMVARLAAGFPTAALAEFSIARPWLQITEGSGQIERFLTPRELHDGKPAAAG